MPALVRALRPRQWTKNILVVVAPVAAGVIGRGSVLLELLIAVVAFTLASSGVYLVNDVVDLDLDRAHPVKCRRPLASGQLSLPVARVSAVACFVGALAVATAAGWQLAAVVALYITLSILYSAWLKHEPVLDLALVSSGFLLRAIGGGVATQVPLSHWFVLATGLGALFVVAGKRYAERLLSERTGLITRPVLASYSLSYLRFVWTMTAAALVVTYALWAYSFGVAEDTRWSVVSIVPFMIVVLRYGIVVDGGGAGEPEEIILGDRLLLGSGAVCTACLLAAVYL